MNNENSILNQPFGHQSQPPPSAESLKSGNLISLKSRRPIVTVLILLALGLGGWLTWRYWSVVPPLVTDDAPPAPVDVIESLPAANEVDTTNWKTYRKNS